jgi:hypothetical protein
MADMILIGSIAAVSGLTAEEKPKFVERIYFSVLSWGKEKGDWKKEMQRRLIT